MARRYDFLRLDAFTRSPQGGIVVPAALTRTGVFTYKRADGSTVRELRHPDQVFAAESLQSLKSATLTIGHVPAVTPDNWASVSVGHVVDQPKQDGRLVTSDVCIQRRDAVTAVEKGELKEVSCGYDVDIDPTPGEFGGERYDCIQLRPRYNHVALLPSGAGRAGPDVSLRTDSAGAVVDVAHVDRTDEAPTQAERDKMAESQFADPENKKYPIDTPEHVRAAASYVEKEHNAGRLSDAKYKEIVAKVNKAKKKHGIGEDNKDSKDGYPAGVKTAEELQAEVDKLTRELTDEKKARQDSGADALLAKIDTLTKERDTLQKRVDGFDKEVEVAATARAALIATVAPHMPETSKGQPWRADGKDEKTIVREVLGVLAPELALEGRSDEYIRARFDAEIESVGRSRGNVARLNIKPRQDGDGYSGDDGKNAENLSGAEMRMRDRNRDAWKTPIRGGLTRDGVRR